MDKLFSESTKAFGNLDILVNNAGVYEFAPLDQITEESYRRQFDLNVLGTLLSTQAAVKSMAKGGSVINLSSVASLTPPATGSVYSATKGAVDVITRSLAQELGPQNIRVNSLAPGLVETEGTRAAGNVRGGIQELRGFAHSPRARWRAAGYCQGCRLPGIRRLGLDHRRGIAGWWRSAAVTIPTGRGAGRYGPALRAVSHFLTSAFSAFMFLRSSSGSSIGVSAMKAACARRGSFSSRRNSLNPMLPSPMC